MAKTTRKKRKVFVSHSSRDTWVARQIAREVETCGAKVFLDEAQIDVGDDFEEEIRNYLQDCDELVVLMTPWAFERPYVWAELGVAWGRGIPIVVLLHGITPGEFQSNPKTPVFLKKRNLIDLNDVDSFFNELKKRARR